MFRNYIVPFGADSFPAASGLNRPVQPLQIRGTEVIRAAAILGRNGIRGLVNRGIPVGEALFSSFVNIIKIQQILSEDHRHFIRSAYYERPVSFPERNSMTYFLGEVFATVFSRRHLAVNRMVTVEEFLGAGYPNNVSLPDYLGEDNAGNWVVMEAKGTTGNYNQQTQNKGKRQSAQITEVDRQAVLHNIVSQTYFNPHLSVRISDPESSEGFVIEKTKGDFLRSYYDPILKIKSGLKSERMIKDYKFLFSAPFVLNGSSFSFGVLSDINALAEETNEILVDEMIIEDDDSYIEVFSDGTAISISGEFDLWS